MSMTKRTVPAGQFKQGCLAMLDEVANNDVEIVVTKRGRPVARLVSVADSRDRESEILGRLRAVGRLLGREADLMAPSSTLAKWKLMPKVPRR
jgi:prevent-host-death family protein